MRRRNSATDSAVARASSLLTEWTGLELRGTAPKRVDDFLKTRARQLGYDAKEAYVDHLQSLEPTDDESQRLINLVTNGLTAFWRDRPQLDALETVFEKLKSVRTEQNPVNVWCAGCSSGEEAYTVAMIADRLDVPVYVLGSDLNTESLRYAVRGVYGGWSLRRTDEAVLERYFSPVDDKRYRIDPKFRQQVDFAHHNILSAPPTPPGGQPWDVIMCRNVLIYFSTDAIETVMRNFGSTLHEDGYLLLGSSEQLHTGDIPEALVPFRAARKGGGFVYRLRQTPPGKTVMLPSKKSERSDAFETPEFGGHPVGLEEETSELTEEEATSHATLNLLDRAVAHLKSGRTEAAVACCEATASYDPFVAEVYCLMGYLLARQGARAQALDSYRKVLFLDPFNWIAAVESARLQMRRGDADRAKVALRQALEGLDADQDLSRGMRLVAEAMERAVTDEQSARAFCEQYLERLRNQKFLD